MNYIRIKSYEGKMLVGEWLYFGNNQCKALERCRKDYPAHNKCILIAETISDEDPKWQEYIKVCYRCGVAH